MADELAISTMSREDMDLAIAWAAEEGWNPGAGDAGAFFAADPAGFLLGRIGGEPAAMISAVAYDGGYGFIGFYITRPDLRGRGHGLAMWRAGMARLGGRLIGLDGVVAQQGNYLASGFRPAHRTIRYGGLSIADVPADPRLARIGRGIAPSILAYDRPFVPAPRDAFLGAWLTAEGAHAMALVEDGEVRGYGVIRRVLSGFKIGPLFADDAMAADVLFRALAGSVKGAEIFIDPPEPNETATALAERYDLSPVFEAARMYTGPAPDLPLGRIFGMTSFELG